MTDMGGYDSAKDETDEEANAELLAEIEREGRFAQGMRETNEDDEP